ncbi:AAA family ATPase [Candidatus Calescamantes bacterium]|nr:AAA family ATPase [Candidatus Calescamantes bacterium]
MKIAVSGKGGVGKTTIVAVLGEVFRRKGKRVILIDADPDANLARTLGIKENITSSNVLKSPAD